VSVVDIDPVESNPSEAGSRSATARRALILDAFERCIQRAGFHRTTMQDVAKEAGMSAGNLYRYFVSKEALVSGMAERDRERFGGDFQKIAASTDVMGAFFALGRKHFVEEPRSRCIQFMEIWAESTRNPAVAAVCTAMDREVTELLIKIVEAGKAAGQVPAHVDSAAMIGLLTALGDGLFTHRALDPDFDAEEGFRLVQVVVDAILTGRLDLNKTVFPHGPTPDESGGEASGKAVG